MVGSNKIIRRKYSDFFCADNLNEKRPQKNLLVTDLDKKGRVLNPKAPCVVTIIDDQYTAAANKKKKRRTFKVKSDVLKLRDVTRHKFFIYVTQQRALEKAREQQLHSIMYRHTRRFVKISSKQLNTSKNELFLSMMAENKKIEKFLQSDISEEAKQHITVHQRLLMEVTDIHNFFFFLLKLIDYFNTNKREASALESTKMMITSDLSILKSDLRFENIDNIQTEKLKEYLAISVKPCLSEQTYLNLEFWIEGYANNRLKLFDYYKQFTGLAILYHVFSIIYSKFIKALCFRLIEPIARDTPQYLVNRTKCLQNRTSQLLGISENQHKSNIYLHIKGLAPVILKKIRQEEIDEKTSDKNNEIKELEEIHTILMQFLDDLDDLEPSFCIEKEREIRKLIARERKISRKVLVKVNRFQNWIKHYKKH